MSSGPPSEEFETASVYKILELKENVQDGDVNEIINTWMVFRGFPGGAGGIGTACQCRRHKRHGFDPLVRKSPWRRARQPIPVFLPGKFHG